MTKPKISLKRYQASITAAGKAGGDKEQPLGCSSEDREGAARQAVQGSRLLGRLLVWLRLFGLFRLPLRGRPYSQRDAVAKHLGIEPDEAERMARQLDDAGMVRVGGGHSVTLTEAGRQLIGKRAR
jgi:hypothetical protein